jgi:asparagine synthase (glutamine-hydrolysing)
VVPKLPEIYDEPFADSSQIPTYLVSRLARQSVTVALSGDGGDELFAGYPRYALTAKLLRLIQYVPGSARKGGARVLEALPDAAWDRVGSFGIPLLSRKARTLRLSHQIQRVVNLLRNDSLDLLYRSLVSYWEHPEDLVPGALEHLTALTDPEQRTTLQEPIPRMMYTDLVSYLPDDILTKVDRASMAVSLEVRVPLLDHRIVEFAWRLPMALRVREGKEKWLLRQVLYKYVPKSLVDRPKMGFAIPVGEWLKGPLREWAEDLLDPKQISDDGLLNPQLIQRAWHEHLSGQRNRQYQLWNILMFQGWYGKVRSADLVMHA